MLKFVRRNINSVILNLILVVIILFFSLGLSYVEGYKDNVYEQQYYIGNECLSFSISNINNISYKELTKVIIEENYGNLFNTKIMGDKFICQGIYLNENLKVKPKLTKGRFFNKDDFKSWNGERLAVIGKGLLEQTVSKGDNMYIALNEEEYKVIGVMGSEKEQRMFDYTMIFNFNDSNFINEYTHISEGWYISSNDSNIDISKNLQVINNEFEKKGEGVKLIEVARDVQPNPIITTLEGTKNITIYFGCFIFAIALNIFILIIQWIGSLEKEIGIRKAFGATEKDIYFIVFKKYTIIAIIASIIAVFIQYILFKLGIVDIDKELSLINFIGVLIFSFIISGILILISIKRLNRIEANNIMKGCQ